MSGRRVLITGLSTFWGGRMAQALERHDDVEVIVGLDTSEPTVELERTEYVRADESYSILARIVKAARIDTIVHTFLVVDSTSMSNRQLHEINVIGTMNLLAAAGAADSTVRTVIVKSSTLVYGSAPEDPVWFGEETPRSRPANTRVEKSLLEVEGYLRDFAEDNPHVDVTLLRFSNVLGTDISTPLSRALEMPLVPSIFGFDPRFQFVDEGDVIRSLLFVLEHRIPGVFNVAGDGLLPWSEVAAICGKSLVPLPPYFTPLAIAPLRRLGLLDLPLEFLELLRFGRGADNRRFKSTGFRFQHTSASAVENFWQAVRLRRTLGVDHSQYVFEEDVETFFRRSPAVVRDQEAT
ncbi:MAG: NAD-dependent epimerase/dehydratase family protein [Actinomycetota bacterium]|nr:NAD-dependent epimerase/dehydratase family protein [Acidimicrobiia bacterium]MDQ3147827.1 NAD-dependent epimerase/dehydratase family protein [Actinomycetota bacterium]